MTIKNHSVIHNFKSGIVAVVGRPNVGKSTLVNSLIGKELSITSKHAHTTRTQIKAIDTTKEYQIVYVDTPGIHKPRFKISTQLNNAATEALQGVDLVLAVFDASSKLGSGDRFIAEKLVDRKNVIVVLNKCDSLNSVEKIADKMQEANELVPSANEIFACSAFTKKNISMLKNRIIDHLETGPLLFDTGTQIDVTDDYLVSEMFREALIRLLNQELPQEIGVIATENGDLTKADQRYFDVLILVTRPSHKPIVIGKAGSMLENAGMRARARLESIFGTHVTLKAKVVVEENWQSNPRYLASQNIFET